MDTERNKKVLLGCLTVISGLVYTHFQRKIEKPRIYRNRKLRVRDIYLRRKQQGLFDNSVAEMKLSDPALFFNFTRMDAKSFEHLLSLCKNHLCKHSPREPIQPAVRLMVTLRFLATGNSYPSLGYAFRIHPSTICNIIWETCNVLWDVLFPIYLKPCSQEEWLNIEKDFYNLWQLPNGLGSIDGKHVRIRAPSNCGFRYFNYEKYHSTILLALCDAKYNFIYVDIGAYGAQSDGGVLRQSTFGKKLFSGDLNIPDNKILPNTTEAIPMYFIGDEAFPLNVNLMRPYSKRKNIPMPEDELVLNYRLSRARRTIENTLGIMVARFRIFHREINAEPETVDAIVKAVIGLHNFIRTHQSESKILYCRQSFVDREENGVVIPGEWRSQLPAGNALQIPQYRLGNRNAPRTAWTLREYLKDYLNSTGSAICPWQFQYVRRTT